MRNKIKTILFFIIVGVSLFYLIYSGYFYILFMFLVYIGFLTMIGVGIWLLLSKIFDNYLEREQKDNEKSIKKFTRRNRKIITSIIIVLGIIFIISLIIYFDIKIVPPDLYFRYK